MNLNRRRAIAGMLAAPVLPLAPLAARAQAYPERTIRIVIPFPGGFTDTLARMVGQKMSESMGQPVVVEQKPGGSGQIGAAEVLRAPADGYTVFMNHIGTDAVNPHIFRKLSYDPQKDFMPVAELARTPNLLVVSPELPVRDVAGLIQLAKARPEPLFFGSPGNGTSGHLAGELFKSRSGLRLTHVPYKGATEVVQDLATGRVHMMFDTLAQGGQLARSGKVRALAVTSRERHPSFPDIPTLADSGFPGWETGPWFGMVVKAGTPAPVVARLQQEASKAVRAVGDRLLSMGVFPIGSTPEQYAAMMQGESQRWGKLVQDIGLKVD
ncbi:tripartite tricarboxylate transporter substrate binding protein [Ramlibacter sp. AW1]|uniref:Tripartite tricarboxylate transporter substrate binding protein n=1 Tax=Ramlibacter aurantiacus TaxID=2801330 RepID=A0A936ZSA7_9BURK|nr:tripartite tricarboxylate transporter substrate binding protein [Ramlibacter aurantiacus]MBL0422761.1 tripartite tricarboxylate transporter substrate binding protein [Ramlibacter aurantiacus]